MRISHSLAGNFHVYLFYAIVSLEHVSSSRRFSSTRGVTSFISDESRSWSSARSPSLKELEGKNKTQSRSRGKQGLSLHLRGSRHRISISSLYRLPSLISSIARSISSNHPIKTSRTNSSHRRGPRDSTGLLFVVNLNRTLVLKLLRYTGAPPEVSKPRPPGTGYSAPQEESPTNTTNSTDHQHRGIHLATQATRNNTASPLTDPPHVRSHL